MEVSELDLLKVQHPAAAQEISEIPTSPGWEGQQREAQKPLHIHCSQRCFPLAPLLLTWGEELEGPATKAELAAPWSLQEKLLAQGKGSTDLSLTPQRTWRGSSISVGLAPCLGHTQLQSPPLPFPEVFQGS